MKMRARLGGAGVGAIPSRSSCIHASRVPGVLRHGPRANWKGFLLLSLVTCPIALYPATSESEKISFNQLNKTGHRIKYAKVDADTGEEVANEEIVKGFKIDTDTYVEVTKEELECRRVERSNRRIAHDTQSHETNCLLV
jgi:non-homologous end joining protein Ku